MFYDGYHFWGMHLIWWCVWIMLLFWIFVTPWSIPGQRYQRETPLQILKRRLAAGQITTQEYNEKKKILETETSR